MEGTYRKRYYSRSRSYGKGKKSIKKENFILNVTKQTLICIIVFLIILGLKSIDISLTKALSYQIKGLLAYTTDIGSAYQSVSSFMQRMNTMLKSNSIPTMNPMNEKDSIKPADPKATENTQQLIQSNSEVQGVQTTQGTANEKQVTPLTQSIVAPLQGVVTSKFGMRMHPIDQKEKFHYGIDIDGKKGADIAAAMDGEVVETAVNDTYGKFIRLQHKDGFYTFYGHCSDVIVKKGQKVKMKDVIGNVGDTGAALGVHLHFEIWKDNKALDPLQYIQLSIDSNT